MARDSEASAKGKKALMNCLKCGDDDTLHLLVQIKENEVVSFFNCHSCHSEWWQRHGQTVDLADVLAMADL